MQHGFVDPRVSWLGISQLVACNSCLCTDAPRRVTVFPLHDLGCLMVVTDISHELPVEILDGGEDAPRDDVALDFREPQFHLIEPG